MAVTITMASIDSLISDESFYERAFQWVDEDRKKIVSRYKYREDGARSLAAGLLLADELLRRQIISHPEDIRISRNQYGKPFLKSNTACFSLSHSGRYAVCAVSDCNIGIDIQEHRKLFGNVASKFCHPLEISVLNECESEEEKQKLFYSIWCAKESYMKYTGLGMSEHAEKILLVRKEISDSMDNMSPLLNYFSPGDMTSGVHFQHKNQMIGYSMCVCTEEQYENLPVRICSFDTLIR